MAAASASAAQHEAGDRAPTTEIVALFESFLASVLPLAYPRDGEVILGRRLVSSVDRFRKEPIHAFLRLWSMFRYNEVRPPFRVMYEGSWALLKDDALRKCEAYESTPLRKHEEYYQEFHLLLANADLCARVANELGVVKRSVRTFNEAIVPSMPGCFLPQEVIEFVVGIIKAQRRVALTMHKKFDRECNRLRHTCWDCSRDRGSCDCTCWDCGSARGRCDCSDEEPE